MNSENKQESVPNDITKTIEPTSVPNVCCGIYGLQNKLNNKWYVGYSKDIYKRWNKVYRVNGCKGQLKLLRALKKYGYDGFNKVVLEECSTDPTIWGPLETKWIRHYNSIQNGYNIAEGGRGGAARRGVPCSERTKRKISKWHSGKILSADHREKIRQSLKAAKRKMSEEQRLKMFAGRHFLSADEIRRRKNERNRLYRHRKKTASYI